MEGGIVLNISNEDYMIIRKNEKAFRECSDADLAKKYFKQMRMGIVGVRKQILYLIALRNVMKERFGRSPIEFDGIILEL